MQLVFFFFLSGNNWFSSEHKQVSGFGHVMLVLFLIATTRILFLMVQVDGQ
jgi:hypothetical protein